MKKIIAVLDGLKYSASTVEYAIFIAKQEKTHLVGVFLEDMSYRSYALSELVDKSGVSDQRIREYIEHDKQLRSKSVKQFEQACQLAGLNYSIHKDKDTAMEALLHESIYADLLIINANETFSHVTESKPSHFMRHLMADVSCPMLLVPSKFHHINKSALLYDGTPSSVYAIRMYDYILPAFKNLPTEVISVKSLAASMHLPDGKLMKEFMKRHYPDATYTVLKGIPNEEIITYLKKENRNSIIVLGAYHRSGLSRWIYPSLADNLLIGLKSPLFIAHSK